MSQTRIVLSVEGLLDVVLETVLGNLPIDNVVCLAGVSKKWKERVAGALRDVLVLAVSLKGREDDYLDFVCGLKEHIFRASTRIVVHGKHREAVLKLIARMPKLVALSVPAPWQSPEIAEVLASCSKLEHLAFTGLGALPAGDEPMIAAGGIMAKLSCLGTEKTITAAAVSNMLVLKRVSLARDKRAPLDIFVALQKNGLVAVDAFAFFQDFDAVIRLGSQFEAFGVHSAIEESPMAVAPLSAGQVKAIVNGMPKLKKLSVHTAKLNLAVLSRAKQLEALVLS